MEINLNEWCGEFLSKLEKVFGDALVFAGLQGSRGRGEAAADSDIDLVVVLAELTGRELELYSGIISSMPYSEKACGFICGAEELRAWSPSELFLLYHDTAPLYGSLGFITPASWKAAAEKALKDGACAIYHGCCHNRLYARDMETLSALYKAAFFTARVKHYCETGIFLKKLSELTPVAGGADLEILAGFDAFRNGEARAGDFDKLSDALAAWSSGVIKSS